MVKSEKVHDAPSASERRDVTELAKPAPLGLGMSGLERKVDSKGKGSMLSGMGRGQGDAIDISRMFQQMMPIVSPWRGKSSITILYCRTRNPCTLKD
ncbi:hypothetical protein RYX36_023126 [Vicia faba]